MIFDNGCGMTAEEARRMQQTMLCHPEESSKSIGLYNIYHRIQLYYGTDYGIHIQSRLKYGTAVAIVIPAPETDYTRER